MFRRWRSCAVGPAAGIGAAPAGPRGAGEAAAVQHALEVVVMTEMVVAVAAVAVPDVVPDVVVAGSRVRGG